VLRNVRIQQFDTAIDDAGRIAIAAARNDSSAIETAVIDVANPDKAEWHALRRDVRVTARRREVQVVATAHRFAAAWINEKHIEAAEFDGQGGGAIADVGTASSYFDIQAAPDALLFWWDDGRHLQQRKLPSSLTAYALMRDLTTNLCK